MFNSPRDRGQSSPIGSELTGKRFPIITLIYDYLLLKVTKVRDLRNGYMKTADMLKRIADLYKERLTGVWTPGFLADFDNISDTEEYRTDSAKPAACFTFTCNGVTIRVSVEDITLQISNSRT